MCLLLIGSGKLTDPDEEALCRVLEGVANRWDELGTKAGFVYQDLTVIRTDLKDRSAGDCLAELVRRWLQREGKVTWKDVVKVLRKVGEQEKAKELATEKGKLLDNQTLFLFAMIIVFWEGDCDC